MEGSDHNGLDESLHGRNVLGLHDEKRTVHGLGIGRKGRASHALRAGLKKAGVKPGGE